MRTAQCQLTNLRNYAFGAKTLWGIMTWPIDNFTLDSIWEHSSEDSLLYLAQSPIWSRSKNHSYFKFPFRSNLPLSYLVVYLSLWLHAFSIATLLDIRLPSECLSLLFTVLWYYLNLHSHTYLLAQSHTHSLKKQNCFSSRV